MSWASERKLAYTMGVLVFIAVVVGVPLGFYLYEPATCFDGSQNQDERGVDCGGVCARICSLDAKEVRVLWSRAFEVTPGIYNAVAYLKNENFNATASDIRYSFKLFDAENLLVAERQGVTTLSLDGTIPIFEPQIETGNRKPVRAFFELQSEPEWFLDEDEIRFRVENIVLSNEERKPRIDARLVNESVLSVQNIETIVTVFDTSGNAVASSRTRIPDMAGRSTEDLVYTWQTPFGVTISQIDIIPRILK